MTDLVGRSLAHYRVDAAIGAGGMGEVFRAHDTKLNRDVAVKVLPASFAEDAERVARFRREAQIVASLNHPNIAAIYGLEEAEGVVALVLELVEGEDLAQRMARGAIPVDEAVGIARQIAEGLEAAHEKGIVHRDLKPANVKLTPGGHVKILDFGLGKALEGEASGLDSGLTNSPTMSRHMTEAGLILGTAAYMSPEQARGKPADKRADVWAFGVVLFEMLTGARLFEGETVSDTLAGVLKGEIDLAALPAGTPGALRVLLRRCLERNPKNRLHDIADARLVLADLEAGVAQETPSAPAAVAVRSVARERTAWGIALVAVAAVLALLLQRGTQSDRARRVIRAALALPSDVSIELDGERAGMPALSSDGKRVAFGARKGSGPLQIWVQELAGGAARPLPGTEGGYRPFWSPDGRRIGYFNWQDLAVTPSEGGPVTRLAPARDARGGTWSPNGTIVYAPYFTGPLYAISERGGETRALTGSPEKIGSGTHRFPQFLPDGEHFLYLDRSALFGSSAGVVVLGSLKGGPPKRVLDRATNAVYAEGHVLSVRDGALVAQPFDQKRLALSGEPKILVGDLVVNNRFAFGNFSASDAGLVAFLTGRQKELSRLVWRDRSGRRLSELGTPGNLSGNGGIALSRDGRWAAASRVDEAQGDSDVWLYDLSRGTETRLARQGSDEFDPVFTPDSGALLFGATEGNDVRAVVRRDLASGQETKIVSSKGVLVVGPMAVTPDGAGIVCDERDRRQVSDVVLIRMDGKGEAVPLVHTPADDAHGQLSPDGRWLTWESDESGRYEVYVAPFPAGGSRVQVSREGGCQPRWNPHGGELFFKAPDNVLTAVPVDLGSGTVSVGAPAPLFPIVDFYGWTYAVAPDGARFLVREPIAEAETSPITLLTDWTSLLKEGRP